MSGHSECGCEGHEHHHGDCRCGGGHHGCDCGCHDKDSGCTCGCGGGSEHEECDCGCHEADVCDCGCGEGGHEHGEHPHHHEHHGHHEGHALGFHRHFISRAERIAELECYLGELRAEMEAGQAYLQDVQAEAKAVEERIAGLKGS